MSGRVLSVNVSPVRSVEMRGPHRAVYAYASEDYRWWEASLEPTLDAGTFGENLTLARVDVSSALIGERWRAGGTLLQVTAFRVPCFKLAHVMGDPAFVKRFAQAQRPGVYLSVVEEGEIAAGDAVEETLKPRHMLTVAKMTHIYFNARSRLAELLVPELLDEWQTWVDAQMAKRGGPQS